MNYRNQKLLKAAKEAPQCFDCGKPNDGTVVAAHSNQGRDGKGTGIKAHDYRIAFCCFDCHCEIDQPSNRFEALERWERAHRRSIGWLFESEIVK